MVIMPLRHLLVLTIISLFIGLSGIGFLGAPDVRFVLLGIVILPDIAMDGGRVGEHAAGIQEVDRQLNDVVRLVGVHAVSPCIGE